MCVGKGGGACTHLGGSPALYLPSPFSFKSNEILFLIIATHPSFAFFLYHNLISLSPRINYAFFAGGEGGELEGESDDRMYI